MSTVTKTWNTGEGSVTVTYNGSGNGTITVTSSDNNLHEGRSTTLTVKTNDNSISRIVTVSQAAKPYIDLSAAVVTAANQTYSGSALTPTPTVTLNGETVPSTGYDVTYSNNTNAGTATITVTGKGDYTGSASGSFTIAKANPVYTAPSAIVPTYSGSAQNLVSAGSSSHGTFTYATSQSGTYSSSIPQGTNAGTYTVWWKFTGDANHNNISATQVSGVSIATKALSITAKAQTITYGNSISTGTGQVTTSGLVTGDSLTAITLTASTNNVPGGTITPSAAATTKGIGNYSVTYNTGTLTINKAAPTYTAPTANSLTYSGGSQYLTTTGSTSHGTIYYSSDGTNWYTTRRTGTNAGSYTTYWKLTGDSNHSDIASTSISTTIAQATGQVTTAPTANTMTYSGSAQYLVTAGSGTGTIYYSYRYKSYSASSWGSWSTASTTRPSRTNAGYYEVRYYAAASSDGNYSQSATGTVSSIEIQKATPTYTAPTKKTGLTYTGSAQALLNAGSTSHGTFYYSTDNSTWSTSIPTQTNANTSGYTVYWKLTGDSNHSDVASTTISGITIAKATGVAGVSSRSLTYNRSAQNLVTVSGNTGTVHYRLGTSGSWSTTIPTATNASTSYKVYYYVDASTNYNAVGSSSSPSSVTSSIAKVTPVVSTAPSKRTGLSYTGSNQNLLSGGSMKFSSSDSTAVAGTFSYAQGKNAGTYSSLTWSFTPTDTTNYNSASGTVTGSVSIAKASRTLSFSNPTTTVQSGGNVTNVATPSAGSGDGSITYSSGTTSVATVNSSGKVTGVSGGTSQITATIAEGTNYLSASASYTIKVAATNFVDLGLPSGTFWADRNIGASSPEGDGLYFSWGNVVGQYDPNCPENGRGNYAFGPDDYASTTGASLATDIPANATYDAAYANLGSLFKMPTMTQRDELISNCTVSQDSLNGVAGVRFTSNINGNSIFMPFTGNVGHPTYQPSNNQQRNHGVAGYYWISKKYPVSSDMTYGGALCTGSNGADTSQNYFSRVYGFQIRAVQ